MESQAAEYFAMVSERFKVLLSVGESSHRSVRAIHQSWVKVPGRAGRVRLVSVPPFLVLVANGDTLHAGLP